MEAVETHLGVKEIVEESWLFVKDGGHRYSFDYDQTSLLAETSPKTALLGIATAKRTINIQTNLDDFCFTGDRFLPLAALQRIETARLRKLQLNSCTDTGYIFHALLCNIANIRLKTLVITQKHSQPGTGYIGREKIECFLMVHKGLEEVVFSNLGEDTPCLPTN